MTLYWFPISLLPLLNSLHFILPLSVSLYLCISAFITTSVFYIRITVYNVLYVRLRMRTIANIVQFLYGGDAWGI